MDGPIRALATIGQLLGAGLAIALGRYDLAAQHKYAPARRVQPGGSK